MPELVHAIPVLASLDISKSLEFYTTKLGFRVVLADSLPGPGARAQRGCRAAGPSLGGDKDSEDFAIVTRDRVEIHFWLCEDPEIPKQTSCHVQVRGIDELFDELEPQGVVHPHGGIEDKPWGLREFPIIDGDGNLIVFTERIG